MIAPASQKIRAFAAAIAVALASISAAGTTRAQPGPRFDGGNPATRNNDVPKELVEISIKDSAGKDVPKDVPLVDQDGKPVTFGDYFDGKRPVLLALAYYECPMLCSLVLTGVLEGMKPLRWSAGNEYRVVVVSFDPRDTAERAAQKRGNYVDAYGRKIDNRGFDFLIGKEADVRRIADAVGFAYRWDAREKQYAHAAGAFVLTPAARVSRTLYGLSFTNHMRLALLEASEGKVGTVVDQVLLFCFHYDPSSGGYILATTRFMKAGGLLTLLALGAFLLRHWRAERRRSGKGLTLGNVPSLALAMPGDDGSAFPATGPGCNPPGATIMSIDPIDIGTFWLPKASSTNAPQVDSAWDIVYWISVAFFVGIIGALVWFTYKYQRRREGEKTSTIDHNTTLEIVWTAGPVVLLAVLFVVGLRGFANAHVAPAESLEIRVTGAKWFWTFMYPNGHITTNEIVVPKDRPVKLIMSSQDVVHSFFVPEFRIKQDAVPGLYTTMWFQATEAKEVIVECAEYCGTSHSDMLGKIIVKPEAEYKDWLEKAANEGAGKSPVEYGQLLYTKKNCFTCHSTDGSRIQGPSFKGLYGKSEPLEGGASANVDENYIRESMLDPNAKIVKGYPAVMPTYKGTLKDSEIDALIAYIKSMK